MDVTVHTTPAGLTWTIAEAMQRSFHAIAIDGRVWLVDPVDDAEALEPVAALGEPAGVIQLLDRHDRGCAALAARMGVPHHRLPDALPGTPFAVRRVLDVPGWHERALWAQAQGVLVVPEAVGTGSLFAVGDGPVGMHPMLRALPPRGWAPREGVTTLLAGHGPPRTGPGTQAELRRALDRARLDLPRLPLAILRAARA